MLLTDKFLACYFVHMVTAWVLLDSIGGTSIVNFVLQDFRQQVVQSPLNMQNLEQSECSTGKTADQGGSHAEPAAEVIPGNPYPDVCQAIADRVCRVASGCQPIS